MDNLGVPEKDSEEELQQKNELFRRRKEKPSFGEANTELGGVLTGEEKEASPTFGKAASEELPSEYSPETLELNSKINRLQQEMQAKELELKQAVEKAKKRAQAKKVDFDFNKKQVKDEVEKAEKAELKAEEPSALEKLFPQGNVRLPSGNIEVGGSFTGTLEKCDEPLLRNQLLMVTAKENVRTAQELLEQQKQESDFAAREKLELGQNLAALGETMDIVRGTVENTDLRNEEVSSTVREMQRMMRFLLEQQVRSVQQNEELRSQVAEIKQGLETGFAEQKEGIGAVQEGVNEVKEDVNELKDIAVETRQHVLDVGIQVSSFRARWDEETKKLFLTLNEIKSQIKKSLPPEACSYQSMSQSILSFLVGILACLYNLIVFIIKKLNKYRECYEAWKKVFVKLFPKMLFGFDVHIIIYIFFRVFEILILLGLVNFIGKFLGYETPTQHLLTMMWSFFIQVFYEVTGIISFFFDFILKNAIDLDTKDVISWFMTKWNELLGYMYSMLLNLFVSIYNDFILTSYTGVGSAATSVAQSVGTVAYDAAAGVGNLGTAAVQGVGSAYEGVTTGIGSGLSYVSSFFPSYSGAAAATATAATAAATVGGAALISDTDFELKLDNLSILGEVIHNLEEYINNYLTIIPEIFKHKNSDLKLEFLERIAREDNYLLIDLLTTLLSKSENGDDILANDRSPFEMRVEELEEVEGGRRYNKHIRKNRRTNKKSNKRTYRNYERKINRKTKRGLKRKTYRQKY